MVNIFDNREKQKKLCHFLRSLCLYSTILAIIYFISVIWIENLVPPKVSIKLLFTYIIVIVGSVIIQRIFVESPDSNEGDN